MAHLNSESKFQSWILTPQEQVQGALLSITQKQSIQNLICMQVNLRLNLELDPDKPLEFLQREAAIKGAIDALDMLLTQSRLAEEHQANPTESSGES